MPYRVRDPEQVVAEIEAEGQPYAVFIDNNLGSRPEYLRRLCRALRPLGIIWSAAVTVDVTDDPALVREMALAGCTGVFVGLETLSDGNLADAHKKTPAAADYLRRVALFHDQGIQVNGSFVLGFDRDGPEVFEETVAWIERARLECATFHILTPYPGTPLFRQLEAEGRLLHRDWSRYDTSHVVFRPARMSVEQLADGYAWCYGALFSHASIWRRRPANPSAVLPYLAMAYLYKRSNRLWELLIRHELTAAAWAPIVEWTRRRHVRYRARLEATARDPVPGAPMRGRRRHVLWLCSSPLRPCCSASGSVPRLPVVRASLAPGAALAGRHASRVGRGPLAEGSGFARNLRRSAPPIRKEGHAPAFGVGPGLLVLLRFAPGEVRRESLRSGRRALSLER